MIINHNSTSLISAYKNVGNIQGGQRLTSGQGLASGNQGLSIPKGVTNDEPPPSVTYKFSKEARELQQSTTTQEIDRRTALSNIKDEDFAATTSTNLSKSVISLGTEAASESSNRLFTSQTQNLLRLPG